jgi:hypothetical protein
MDFFEISRVRNDSAYYQIKNRPQFLGAVFSLEVVSKPQIVFEGPAEAGLHV